MTDSKIPNRDDTKPPQYDQSRLMNTLPKRYQEAKIKNIASRSLRTIALYNKESSQAQLLTDESQALTQLETEVKFYGS